MAKATKSSKRKPTATTGKPPARKAARKPVRKTARKPPRAGPAGRSPARRKPERRWSAGVTRNSDALDLKRGVFTLSDPKRIAASLRRSAERSRRRKADPYRSALSMLTFYVSRAGKNLPAARKKTLQRAKIELRKQFAQD